MTATRRSWWQILGDWLAKRFPWARGENSDPGDVH